MNVLTRALLVTILLVATIGLSACDNSAETPQNAVATTTLAATIAVTETAAEVIAVGNPRIRATAPGQMVSGAFMTLTNASATPHALTSVSFTAADTVEIHETSMNGEMMRMRQVGQIDIPANGSVELKPGSYHIMLMGLKKELAAGTTETLTLTFSDTSQMTVEASVGDLSK